MSDRLERILEIVYGVEGVLGARVWQSEGLVAVGVHTAPSADTNDVLRRVKETVRRLEEPGERWEFGLIGEEDLVSS